MIKKKQNIPLMYDGLNNSSKTFWKKLTLFRAVR